MFPDYFTNKVFKPPQNNTLNPTIKLLKTGIRLPPGSGWAEKVTKLLADVEYQELVAGIALIQANKGHKVLVIADRTDFLLKVSELLEERATCVIGETKDRKAELQKIIDGECDILCGSRQIFSEGISLNTLSCVVLGVPLASEPALEQIIGRIQRLAPGKLDPVVVDLQFSGPTEVRQNSKRLALYLEKGWKVETV
jgi:superfamily II DNA or RNA helicase